jgi:hypothetical protein
MKTKLNITGSILTLTLAFSPVAPGDLGLPKTEAECLSAYQMDIADVTSLQPNVMCENAMKMPEVGQKCQDAYQKIQDVYGEAEKHLKGYCAKAHELAAFDQACGSDMASANCTQQASSLQAQALQFVQDHRKNVQNLQTELDNAKNLGLEGAEKVVENINDLNSIAPQVRDQGSQAAAEAGASNTNQALKQVHAGQNAAELKKIIEAVRSNSTISGGQVAQVDSMPAFEALQGAQIAKDMKKDLSEVDKRLAQQEADLRSANSTTSARTASHQSLTEKSSSGVQPGAQQQVAASGVPNLGSAAAGAGSIASGLGAAGGTGGSEAGSYEYSNPASSNGSTLLATGKTGKSNALVAGASLVAVFFLLSEIPLGIAATPKSGAGGGMPNSPEECKKTAGTPGVNGYMPRGATDENLQEYQQATRCAANNGRPIDSETCKESLNKLYEVASELNRMVKKNCDEFIPKFTQDPEVMKCIASQANKNQSGCTQGALSTLSKVNPVIREFKTKLRSFHKVLNELQNQGFQVSEQVVKVIDEGHKAKGTPKFSQPSSSAQQMGVTTLQESDVFNGGQDPRVAAALLSELQSKFQNSEQSYQDVNAANYGQKFQPIEEGWQKLNQVQSKMLREHVHSYLNAEELKLATTLYENQLQEVDAQVERQTAVNNQTLSSLGPAAPQLAAPLLASQANSGLTGDDSGIGLAAYSNIPGAKSGALDSSQKKPAAATSAKDGEIVISSNTSAPEFLRPMTSGASKLSQSSSAKDALRKRLKSESAGEQGISSAGGAAIPGTKESSNQESKNLSGKKGPLGENGELDSGGKGSDRLLANFSGQNLLDTGFSMEGSATDGAVEAIVDGFHSALNEHQLENAGIGSEDDVSLFMRVRDFHDKCLKSGCVTGLAKK